MRLLLLAGTPEARQIASALSRDSRVSVIVSLARPTPNPHSMGLPMRIGGWGSDAAFADWLERERIDAVLDATHPFATQISHRTALASRRAGIDHLQFLRPSWVPGPDDDWIFLNAEDEAAPHAPCGAAVYLMTGLRKIEQFQALAPRPVFVPVSGQPRHQFPFHHGGFVRMPETPTVNAVIDRFLELGIGWVIARNSGGAHGMPALEAARQLGLSVGMVRRPPQPEALRAQTISEALAWVRRRL